MGKKELILELSQKTGFKQSEIRLLVDAFIETIADHIQKGEKVNLRGLGILLPLLQKSRPVRNPRTGEKLMLVPRKSVKFKLGDDLMRKLNN